MTRDEQLPIGKAVNERMVVAENLSLPGIHLDPAQPIRNKKTLRRPRGLRPSAVKTAPRETSQPQAGEFSAALAASRLRRDEGPSSAREILERMESVADPQTVRPYRERLRIGLEDRGQQTILKYLRGDQVVQTRADFERGARDFEAAIELGPSMLFDESRLLFCRGRALIFSDQANRKDYQQAVVLLERAIRLDPDRAYAYNALGIAYLEQAPQGARYYDQAIAAFHDAIRRAPYWTYPWHNLALTLAERGNYEEAARYYNHAMDLAPQHSYLPYNLGLLYQRMNRMQEAEASYRKALQVATLARQQGLVAHAGGRRPEEAEAVNALGTLAASRRKRKAEELYRQALEIDPDCVSARSNLALLLSESSARHGEAESLWERNLDQDPWHLPSRIGLAKLAAGQENWNGAILQWTAVLESAPHHAAARIELAKAYIAVAQLQPALAQLREAEKQSESAVAWEQLGDLYAAAGDIADARRAYHMALDAAKARDEPRLARAIRKKIP